MKEKDYKARVAEMVDEEVFRYVNQRAPLLQGCALAGPAQGAV